MEATPESLVKYDDPHSTVRKDALTGGSSSRHITATYYPSRVEGSKVKSFLNQSPESRNRKAFSKPMTPPSIPFDQTFSLPPQDGTQNAGVNGTLAGATTKDSKTAFQ